MGIAGLSSGISAMPASVVISRPAADAASCSAVQTTLVGSITPADQVLIGLGLGVEAKRLVVAVDQLAGDDRAVPPGILRDLANRCLQGLADDVEAAGLVVVLALEPSRVLVA